MFAVNLALGLHVAIAILAGCLFVAVCLAGEAWLIGHRAEREPERVDPWGMS